MLSCGRVVRSASLAVSLAAASPAFAACPIELATYADTSGVAELEFTPGLGGATVSNSFRLLLGNDVVLDGIVQWLNQEERPWGMLMYKCPGGDVTGDDLAACTPWEGVIYTADDKGNIGLLPEPGKPAPPKLILSALGPALRMSAAYDAAGLSSAPQDVFALKGCQE
jgi:hypothetical protein